MTDKIADLEAQLAAATHQPQKIDLLNELARELRESDPQRAFSFGEQAYALAQQGPFETAPYQKGLAYSFAHLGSLNYDKANYAQALAQSLEAVSIFEEINHAPGLPAPLSTVGLTYLRLGNYAEAMPYQLKALKVAQELGDQVSQAKALNGIAIVYVYAGDHAQALTYFDKSLRIYQQIGDRSGEAVALINLCMSYRDVGDYERSLACGFACLEICQKIKNNRREAMALNNIGNTYLALGQGDAALVYFHKALALIEKMADKFVQVFTLLHAGKAHYKQKQFEAARSYLDQALSLAKASDQKGFQFECYQALAEIYKAQGDFEQALKHYEQFHLLKERVFNEEADNKLKNLEVLHRTETIRKEAEIYQLKNAALEQEIAERKGLEQQIRESLERRRRHVQIAAQISQEMTVVISKEQLYSRVVTLIKEQFGFYNAQLFHYEPEKQALVLVAGHGESGAQMVAASYQVALGQGLIGAAAASGVSMLQPDVAKAPNWRPNPYLPQTRGELAIPIKSGQRDLQAQVFALQYFVEKGFDGLIISVANRDLVASITQQAIRQNIPVVSFTSTLGPEEQTTFLGPSEHEMGYTLGLQAGAWAKVHIPAEQSLKIAILNYRWLSPLNEREEGMIAGLKQIFEGEVEIVASETAGDYSIQSLLVAERWLKRYPDLHMILAINDTGALGAYQAVIAAGKDDPGQFFVGGIDAIEEALNAIKKGGAYQATVDISARETGTQAVRCLVRAIKGLPYQKVNEIKPRPVNRANLEAFLNQKDQAVSPDPPAWEGDLTGLDLSGVKIGLCLFSLANPFYAILVKGARAEAERLGVELVINEARRILGVLAVQSDAAGSLNAEDQLTLEGVAGQIAVVLEKTLLLEMVEERTQKLQAAQERLIRQEKLAVLGQLAGGVAHELRNPLGVISNAIYFLKMVLPEAEETVREYLDLITGRVGEAEKIVAGLLDLARIRPAAPEQVALSTLVEEALQRCPPPAGITVGKAISDSLSVWVDPQQIRQGLVNLVTNAYQAMPEGGALRISTQVVSGGAEEQRSKGEASISPLHSSTSALLSPYITLTITDTGVGMSPEVMTKIFEPLYTTKARGIGLGLTVSKNLVEVNGGTIEVESVKSQGSTFTITLPTRETAL